MRFKKLVIVSCSISAGIIIAAMVFFAIAASGGIGLSALLKATFDIFSATFGGTVSSMGALVVSYAGLALIPCLVVPWLIIDIRRKRFIVFLFVVIWIIACLTFLFTGVTYLAIDNNLISKTSLTRLLAAFVFGIIGIVGMLITFVFDLFNVDRYSRIAKPQQVYQDLANEKTPSNFKEDEEEVAGEEDSEEVIIVEEAAPKVVKTINPVAEKPNDEKAFVSEPKEKVARKTQTVSKSAIADASKKAPKVVKDDGTSYAKAYHVSRRPELNKWQVKATGAEKALKLFDTQKEAIEYAESLSRSTGAGVRVHSKAGKLRKQ